MDTVLEFTQQPLIGENNKKMHNIPEIGRSPTAPVSPDAPPRSLLSSLFLLSLGVIYPVFLGLVFLRPEWLLQLVRSNSGGYLISGLCLVLLCLCFVLASAHFRSANRQYQRQTANPIFPVSTTHEQEKQYPLTHGALPAHQHNHPGE